MKISWPFARQAGLRSTPPDTGLFDGLADAIDGLDTRFKLATIWCADDKVLAAGRSRPGFPKTIIAAASPEASATIIACVPARSAQTAFLILPNGEAISAANDGFSGPAISFRLMQVPNSGLVELRHPIARARRLGIVPHTPGLAPFRVLFDRVGDPVLDRFTLAPIGADRLGPAGRAILDDIATIIGPPLDAARLLAALQGGAIGLGIAEALLRLLPADQMEVVARQAISTPATLALLQHAMPADPGVTDALPALIAWRDNGRKPTATAHCDIGQGYVTIPHGGTMRPQAGLMIQNLARKTVAPRRNAAILATMRDEGAYVLDWLSYHRALGFEHAVIYTNDNFDGSDDLLELLAAQGLITWVRNDLGPDDQPQTKAYGHALKCLPDLLDYRWTMILDADEYVGLDSGMFPTVQDYIAWQEHQRVDAIALRWLVFSAREHDIWSDASTVQRFTWREQDAGTMFKTMIRTNQFSHSHAHFPFGSGDSPFVYRWEDGTLCYHMAKLDGKEFREPKPTASLAWIAHYSLRSMSEMLDKVVRGDAWTKLTEAETRRRLARLTKQFFRMAASPDLVEDRRMLPFSQRHQAEHARIEALPGIATANAELRHRYRQKLARISNAVTEFGRDIRDPTHHDELIERLRHCAST